MRVGRDVPPKTGSITPALVTTCNANKELEEGYWGKRAPQTSTLKTRIGQHVTRKPGGSNKTGKRVRLIMMQKTPIGEDVPRKPVC